MVNKRQTRKIVRLKSIIKQVAESSKYHQYEVADVLDHFIAVFTKELLAGKLLKIKGFGHFWISVTEPLTWYSGALKKEVHRKASTQVRYGMDADLKKCISKDGALVEMYGKEEEYGPKRKKTD